MPYIKTFLKYLNAIFGDTSNDSPGITFLEMVVDYELATGMSINHPKHGSNTPWSEKSMMLRALYKFLVKNKLFPTFNAPILNKRVRTLNAFRVGTTPGYTGLNTRCKLMMNEGAEIAIVRNLVAFHTCGPAGQIPRQGIGSVNHQLVYKRTGTTPVVIDPDVRTFEGVIQRHLAAPKRRIRTKRPCP